MTGSEAGWRLISGSLVRLAGTIPLLLWIGICAYQSYVGIWVGGGGLYCASPHIFGSVGAVWTLGLTALSVAAVAGLSAFVRTSIVNGADRAYWALTALSFVTGGIIASFLSFLTLAAWDSANSSAATDAWQPMLRFIISGTAMVPWGIGIVACIVIGIRTSRPVNRLAAAITATTIVLVPEALAVVGYLALLSYYFA